MAKIVVSEEDPTPPTMMDAVAAIATAGASELLFGPCRSHSATVEDTETGERATGYGNSAREARADAERRL